MGRKKKGLKLQVYMHTHLVGYVNRASTGAISFQYDNSWLSQDPTMPISNSLPLRTDPFTGVEVYNYFQNLLPDSPPIRKKIAERVGAKSSELLDLLSVIGKDCVGALQFLPEGSDFPDSLPELTGREVTDAQIEQTLRSLAVSPLGLRKDSDFRISLTGAQEKTALLKINERWYEPEGPVPTSHILKKSMGQLINGIDMTESVQNEWLCLQICRKLGLPVANAEIAVFGETQALVVERFDRKWSDDKQKLFRIPIEDICQALGVSTTQKYESDGGPGVPAIMGLLNISNVREKDQRTFMKAQIIFQLLGAIDGHAKNFSLFMGPRGINLTPIYDVLTAYPALKGRQIEIEELKLAMAVGNSRKYRLGDIQRRHWYQTAKLANFSSDFLDEILDEIRNDLSHLTFQKGELPENFSEELLEATLEGLQKFNHILV